MVGRDRLPFHQARPPRRRRPSPLRGLHLRELALELRDLAVGELRPAALVLALLRPPWGWASSGGAGPSVERFLEVGGEAELVLPPPCRAP